MTALAEKRVEFPRGSGIVAFYDEVELAEIADLTAAVSGGRLERAECENAVRMIHNLKAFLGARLRVVPPDAPVPIEARRVRPVGRPRGRR